MSVYQTFFDGMALGFVVGFLAFYLVYRYMASRPRKPKSPVDKLVDEIQDYYRHASESRREDLD